MEVFENVNFLSPVMNKGVCLVSSLSMLFCAMYLIFLQCVRRDNFGARGYSPSVRLNKDMMFPPNLFFSIVWFVAFLRNNLSSLHIKMNKLYIL